LSQVKQRREPTEVVPTEGDKTKETIKNRQIMGLPRIKLAG